MYAPLGNRDEHEPSDLVQGTLDLLILKMLALEPLHGFAISQRLKQMSGDILQVSDGSLYPALHKLEQQGLDRGRVEADGEQPPREVLRADAIRQEAAREGNRIVGPSRRRDLDGGDAARGVT